MCFGWRRGAEGDDFGDQGGDQGGGVECGGSDARGAFGLGGQATGPEGADGLLRPWVMRRLLRSGRWASYEFLSLPWQRHRIPPRECSFAPARPTRSFPTFSSHTHTFTFCFFSLFFFSIPIPSRLCTHTTSQTTEFSQKKKNL